jgi:hypothetical protein
MTGDLSEVGKVEEVQRDIQEPLHANICKLKQAL